MRGPAKNIKCTNKLAQVVPVTTLIHCFKQMLWPSHFRDTLPKDLVANAEGAMAMEIAQHRVLPATPVARRTTGPPSAEWGGTVQQDVHHPWEGHSNRGKGDQVASSSRKAKEAQGTSSTMARSWVLPRHRSSQRHTRLIPSKLPSHSLPHQHTLPKCLTSVVNKEEMVKQVKPAGPSRPAHPPKDAGETFINSFMCDTVNSIGNEEYDDCNKTYKVYTDTDSDGKTEIITDINVKF